MKSSIVITSESRIRGTERVDGSYDLETGEVILWEPDESDQEGLFIVLTHEWGHKLYHEGLTDTERAKWLRFRSEGVIDFELSAYYSAQKLPEEEYASLFSLVSQVLYWRRNGMRSKSSKLAKKIDEKMPKARALIEKHITTSRLKNKSGSPRKSRSIYHREVEMMKKWIREAIS